MPPDPAVEEVIATEETQTEVLPISEPAPVTEPEEGNFVEADFSEIVDFVDNENEPTAEVVVEPVSVSEVPPEGETPPEVIPVEPVVEPVVEATSEEVSLAPEPLPTPEPVAPEVHIPTKEEMEGMYDDFKKETLPVLEKIYEMDDELAAAYDENPKDVLPKIAAQIHYDAMMSSYNAVMAAVPSVVGRVIQAANLANAAEGSFMDAWPQLNDKKYEGVVRTAVQSYRQSNPTASLEDVVQKAGTLAMINAGLSLDKVDDTPPKPVVKPAMPVAPGGQVQVTAPVIPTGESDNAFGDLAAAWDQDA